MKTILLFAALAAQTGCSASANNTARAPNDSLPISATAPSSDFATLTWTGYSVRTGLGNPTYLFNGKVIGQGRSAFMLVLSELAKMPSGSTLRVDVPDPPSLDNGSPPTQLPFEKDKLFFFRIADDQGVRVRTVSK